MMDRYQKNRRELAFGTWIYFDDTLQQWRPYGYSDATSPVDPPMEQIALLDVVRDTEHSKDIDGIGTVMYVKRVNKWLYFLRRGDNV